MLSFRVASPSSFVLPTCFKATDLLAALNSAGKQICYQFSCIFPFRSIRIHYIHVYSFVLPRFGHTHKQVRIVLFNREAHQFSVLFRPSLIYSIRKSTPSEKRSSLPKNSTFQDGRGSAVRRSLTCSKIHFAQRFSVYSVALLLSISEFSAFFPRFSHSVTYLPGSISLPHTVRLLFYLPI